MGGMCGKNPSQLPDQFDTPVKSRRSSKVDKKKMRSSTKKD